MRYLLVTLFSLFLCPQVSASSISATVPVSSMEGTNATLEAQGFGPNNFSIPLQSVTGEAASHAGLHSWHVQSFLDALQSIPEVNISTDGEGNELYEAHIQSQGLEWVSQEEWYQDPIMTGDQRTLDGKLWESMMDYNVWPPPIGWREVVASGCPDFVQPTGAHDAYNIGDCVNFEGQQYESNIDANVWSPTVYPQGWSLIGN